MRKYNKKSTYGATSSKLTRCAYNNPVQIAAALGIKLVNFDGAPFWTKRLK